MNYLERCAEVVNSLNPEVLGNCALDTVIGRSGSATVYGLGSLATSQDALDVALKHVTSPGIRLFGELRDIVILENRVPELVERLPLFIGTVTLKGQDDAAALITEDASKSGSVQIRQTPMDQRTLELLNKRFADVGGLSLFDRDTLVDHTCFDVDGQQKILDLAPSIFLPSQFRRWSREEYEAASEQAFEGMSFLDMKIGADSELAVRLTHV